MAAAASITSAYSAVLCPRSSPMACLGEGDPRPDRSGLGNPDSHDSTYSKIRINDASLPSSSQGIPRVATTTAGITAARRNAGRMRKTRGNNIRTGARRARSSARAVRSLRTSRASRRR